MSERVAIVTGGGQGIGKGIAQRLLRDGMRVMIADLDVEAGDETVAEYSSLGPVAAMQVDVADEAAVVRMVDETVERFGRVDALVNNAGIAEANQGPVEELALEQWTRMIATNLTGAFICAKHTAPELRKHGGSIVNIASIRALQSQPNTEAYAASKGGLVALTHALAISLGPEIRVNCISPGWILVEEWRKRSKRGKQELREIDHAQHPAGRAGRPEDVAALVAWLIGSDAGFITGQHIILDGGMTRKMVYAE